MILHHVVSKAEHIRGGRCKGYLPQIQQVSQDVPADSVAHIPQQTHSLWVDRGGCLDYFMQQNKLIHGQNGQRPAGSAGLISLYLSRLHQACLFSLVRQELQECQKCCRQIAMVSWLAR